VAADVRNLRVSSERLWQSLMQMSGVGATARGGCNRQALTDADAQGRDLFVRWAREAGCAVSVDQMGNLFAARAGSDAQAEPVLVGSHLDTQATGGRFDGVYGVLAGMEVVRTLNDNQITTQRPIELVSWTNEEGCRFAPAMLGSGVMAGVYDLAYAYARTDKAGASLGEELSRIGYKGEVPARPRRFRAAFEAHIEQGPILEASSNTIGVVTGIQGAYWLDVILEGVAAHAGPTPMDMRRDPWRAACPIIDSAFAIALRQSPWGRATIGDLKAFPGARNTVPERLIVSVDLRHPEAHVLESMVAEFRERVSSIAGSAGIPARLEQVWHMPPTKFDGELVELIARVAGELGFRWQRMVSGAGHDSLHTARFAPTAMIFVPCEGGLSHNESESAQPHDLAAGANVLLQAVVAAAG
jgi:beta-ureidopropionase / N-carbamoyl-L-amino-acid hydrolase